MVKLVKNNGYLALFKGFNSTILTRSGAFAYFGGQEYANRYFLKKHPEKGLTNFEQFLSGGFYLILFLDSQELVIGLQFIL
jgi:hypothetical protein